MTKATERKPDWQYHNLLQRIMTEGFPVMSQQEEPQYRIVGHQMEFDLENGFPLITERDLSGGPMRQAFGELCGLLNGAHTLEQLKTFGNTWWAPWVTEAKCKKRGLPTGDMGFGYGMAFREFPTADGHPYDQFRNVMEQMVEMPQLLTHLISPWIPQCIIRGTGKQQRVTVAPCHGWIHFILDPSKKELYLNHWQRSADAPVGLVFDMAMYGALAMMAAQVIGYRAKKLVYQISCPHIFERQRVEVMELLKRVPRTFPTLTLDPSITDIFAFRREHFTLTDYHPHEGMRIETPV